MTAALRALDWMREPLGAPCRLLIEASAGTGKTHALALLYLRLLLESEGIAVTQILLGTFTEAAAAELRQRVRLRIEQAIALLDARCRAAPAGGNAVAGHGQADAALAEYLDARPDPAADLLRLRRAHAGLDRAPILTLHGFCQRVLAESALETGSDPGQPELLDGDAVLEECLLDFWRRRYHAGLPHADERVLVEQGPDRLLAGLRDYFNLHEPRVYADGRAEAARLLQRLHAPDARKALLKLADDRTRYAPKNTSLSKRLRELHAVLTAAATPPPMAALPDKLHEITAELVAKQQHPDMPPLVDDALIRDCIALAALRKDWPAIVRGAVLQEAIAACRQTLQQRLQQHGAITYASMIERVRERVVGDAAFAASLQQRYPVALLDEFQDTDAAQYGIFDTLYRARGTLLLVGDPKQAIYGFRGGDIATYRRAVAAASARVALTVNWRSTQPYLDALNALYAKAPAHHLGAGIAYAAVRGGGMAEAHALCHAGMPLAAPLTLRAPQTSVLTTVKDGDELALDACADDIAAMLADARWTLAGAPLSPGSIAVLLPTHANIAAMAECLRRRGVPVVGARQQSVYDSAAAHDLRAILAALLEPRLDTLRAAWISDVWGLDATALQRLDDDAPALQAALDDSLLLAQAWRRQGPLALCMRLAERAAARLLARQDGERILTDLRHLGELLQLQAAAGAAPAAQWQYLCSGHAGADDADRTQPLRVDSDRARVQLRTLASAKGLQWPLVFLPLAWRQGQAGGRDDALPRFHDASDTLSVDLGSAQRAAHRAAAAREQREERARLFYVAVTRAEQACWIYWLRAGRDAGSEASPLASLLAAQGARAGDDGSLELGADFPAARVHAGMAAAPVPYRAPAPALLTHAALVPPAAPPPWQHWSFSALLRGSAAEPRAAADETQDADSVEARPESVPEAALQTLAMLRGCAFGDAVHALLEQAVGDAPILDDVAAITERLREHGVLAMAGAAALLAERLRALRAADLGDGLRLDRVPRAQQVAELEFLLPLADVPVARLRALLAAHDLPLPWLSSARLRGMLGGFVDLIVCHQGRYHVLDYKTNWLGAALADYRGAALDAAMQAHHYPLQALLYVLALHRYLRTRLPDYDYATHIGDARYLFVRAAGLQGDAGIWRHRFAYPLVQQLDALCMHGEP